MKRGIKKKLQELKLFLLKRQYPSLLMDNRIKRGKLQIFKNYEKKKTVVQYSILYVNK